jgi:beta-1,4-mannooligosaccharide phosphorylase
MSIHVKRTATILKPDQSRVLLRPFIPGDPSRLRRIFFRILSLPENLVGPLLDEVSAEFSQRHQQIRKLFLERFEQVRELLLTDEELSEQRRLLIGSYFLAEYSLESAALFNPSIVPHPDQTDLPSGALRFILSLRATGEGHISSITFRTGIIHPDHRIEVRTPTGFLTEPRQIPNPLYEKALFARKLFELGLTSEFTRRVMNKLGESFALEGLRGSLYCIGAFLLDRDDLAQVIGRLRELLLKPKQSEREGYVPNVVYTCGALLHNGELIIPYGLADHATGLATVPLDEVLAAIH